MSERVTKKKFYKRWWFWLIVVVFIILIIAGASGSSDSSKDSSTSKTKSTKNVSKKKVPTEYRNAYEKAKDYMNFKGFSKKGLYEQLTSDAGEGFSDSAATYAVNNFSEDDYKKAAVKSAKDYSDNMHMSANDIYDQLTSDAGEKFTPAEAKYALKKLNLKITKTNNLDNDAAAASSSNSNSTKNNNDDDDDSSDDDPYAEGRKSQKESDDWMKKFEQGQNDQEKEDNPDQQQDSNDTQQSDSPDNNQQNDDND